ncbi:hypothetical protein FNF27_03980 [Cafeteria roenbergensis]|uniref:RING-type E3 ubiquitin transferase n=1 Tax=Cafeteria roenbergensis TaxID=33653 RepID=A0A5A8E9Y1_CAFRO|nr:hypothetical protein FNF27_03980 [Cafeteria roenbergensis]
MLVLLLASVALAQTPYPKSLPLYFLFNLDASVRNLGSSIAMHDGDLAIGQWNQAYVTEMGYDLTSSQVLQDATLASSDVDGSAPPGPVGVDAFGGLSVAWSDRRAVLLASKAGDGQWVRAAELGSNVGRPTSLQATASSDIPEHCRLAALGSASSEQFSARIVKAAVGPGTLAVTVHLSRQDGAFCRSVAVFEEACLPGRGLESPAERLALDLLVNGTVPMRGNASVANGTAGRPWLVQAGPGDPRPDAGYSALLNATSAIAVGEPGSCRRGAAGPTAAWGSHPLKAAAAAAARPLWLRTGLVLSDDASFGNALTISADALVVGVPDAPGGGAAAMLRRGAPLPQRPQAGPGWETASLGSLSDALAVPSAGAAAWQAAVAGASACLAADVNATSALACFETAHEATMRAAGDAAGGWVRLGWGSSPLAATSDAAAGRLWASRWHNAGTLSPGLVLQAAFPEQATSVSTAGWRFGAAVSLRDPLLVVGSPGADTRMLPARATPDAPGVAGEVGAAGSGAVWAFEAPARIGGVVPDSLVAVGALSDGWNWERAAETSQAFRTLDAGATVDAASHAAAVEAATQARLLSGAVARARAEAAEQAAASATASDPSTPQVERRAADPLKWPRPRHDAGARAGDPAAGAWFRVDGETAAAQRRLGGAAVSVWLSAGAHATPGGIGLGCLASQGSAGGGMGASLASLTKGDTSFIFAGAPGVNTVFVTQLRRPVNASLVGVAPAGTRLAQGSIPRCQALEGVVGFDVTSESNAGATLAVSHGTLYIGAPDASNAGRGTTAQPGRVYVKQFCFEKGVVTPSRFPFSRESPGFCSPCSGQHIAPSFSSTVAECTTCLRDLPDLATAQPPDDFPCAFQCDSGSFGTECRTCSQFQFRQGASLPPGAIWADAKDVCGWTCPAGFRLLPNATGCEPPPPPAPPLLAAVLPAVEPSSAAGPNASAALSAVAVGSVFEAAFAVPANHDEPAPLLSAKALLFPAAAMPAVASPTSAAMAIDVAWTPVASLSAWSLATGDELPTTIAHVSGVQAANEATRAAMATLAAAGGGNATLAQMIQEGSASVFTARFSYMPRGFEGAIGLAVGNGGGWGNATLALSLINASVVAADAALSGPWQLDVSASPKAPELARSGEVAWPREMLAIPASGAAAVAWAPPLGQAVFPSLGLGDFPVPHDPTLQTQLCIMAPPSVLDAVCSTGVLLTLGKPASSQWLPPALQPALGGWPLKRVVAIVDDQTWSGLDFGLGVQAPASGAAPRARSLVVTGLRAGMLLSLALNASLGLLGIQVAGNGTAPVASLLGAGGFGRAVGFQELLPGGSMDTPLLLAEPDGAVRVSLHADAIPGGFDVAVALVLQNEAGPSRAGAVAVCSAPAPVAPAAPPAVAWDSSTSPGASSPGPDGVILLGRAPSFLGRSPLAGMRFEAAAVRGPGMGHSFTGTADSRSDLLVPGSGLDAALELSAPPLWALTHYCGRSSATNAAALDGPWSSPEAATLVPEQHGTACVQTSAAVAPSAPGVPSIVQQQVAPSVLALMWDAPAQVGGDRVEEYLLQMADSATGVVAWEQVLTTPLQRNASAGPADHTRAVALVGGVVPSAAARTFRVAARTAAGGESLFGPALSVVFDRAVHPPGTPGRLATSPVTHLSGPALQLKWRPPLDTGSASAPLSFEVQVVSTNASHGVLANRSSPSSSSSSSSPVQQHQQQATSVLFNSSAVQCQRVAVAWHSPATALAALAASQAAPLECTAELVGLQAHAAFELRIRASNGAGPGPWSASSEQVVTGPPAPPTPPRVWATQRSGQSWIEACWLPGSSDGGSPVTSFALSATVARHSPALAAFANETLFGGIQARIAWKGVAPQSLSSADAWLEPVQVGAVSVAQGMAAGVLQSGGSASQAGAMSAGAGAGSDSLGAQQCAHVRGLPGASVVHVAVAATTAAGTSAVSATAHEDAVAMAAESDADHRRFGLALTALAAPPGSVSELTVLPANSSGSSLGLAELVFRCPVDWGGGTWLDAPGLRLWLHPASQAARNASCAGARAEGHSELPSEVHVVDVPPWAIELVNGSTSSQLVAGDASTEAALVVSWHGVSERAAAGHDIVAYRVRAATLRAGPGSGNSTSSSALVSLEDLQLAARAVPLSDWLPVDTVSAPSGADAWRTSATVRLAPLSYPESSSHPVAAASSAALPWAKLLHDGQALGGPSVPTSTVLGVTVTVVTANGVELASIPSADEALRSGDAAALGLAFARCSPSAAVLASASGHAYTAATGARQAALAEAGEAAPVVGDGGEWVAAAEARTRELPFPAPVLVVSGLRAGTTYRGMCRVLSSAGASPERPSASFRTALPDPASEPQNVVVLPETLELPEAVQACASGAALSSSAGNSSTAGLQARARGPTWMSLRWDPPATDGGSDVLSYVVVVSCEESRTLGSDAAAGAWGSATSAGVPSSLSSGFASGTATRGVRVGNVTRAVLRGLPAGCSATVTVAAVTAAGRGSAAVAASGLRLPLPPAEALALPGVDAASVRLEAPSAGPGPLLVAKWAPGPHALRLGVASQAFVLLLNRTLQPGLPPAGNPGGDAVWAKDPPSLFALVNAAPAARAAAWAAEAVARASGSECGVSEVGCLGQVPAQLPSGAAAAAALQPAAWLGEYGESIAGALATAAQANGVCGAARDSDGVGWAVQGLDASASLEWSHTVPSATARARYALSVAHARSAASVAAFSAEAAAIQASLVRGVRPAFPPAVELGLAAALAAGGLERGEAVGNATAVTRDAAPPGPVGRPALAASAGPDCLDLAWAVPETHGRPVIGYAVRIEDAEAAATEAAVRRAPFPWNSSVTPDGVVWGPHVRLAPPPLSILTVLPADRNFSDAVRAAAAALGEASPLAALPAPRTLEQGDTGVPLSAGFQQSPSPEGAHSVRICGLRQFRSYEVSVVAISVAGVRSFHEAPASLPLSTEASVPPGPVRSLRVADLRVVADAVGVATKAEGGHFLRETRSVWTENSPEDRARAWDTWQNALPLSALAAAPPAWGKNALGPLREAAPVALVSWLPPVSLGGSPLLCYEVSVRAVGVVADPCGSGPGRKACAPGEDGRPSSGVASMWSAGDRSWDSLVQQALGPGAGPAANAIVSPRDSDGKAPETISDAMSLLYKAGLSGSALWPDDAHEGESAQAPQIWPQSAVPVTGTPESGLQISSNTTMGPGDAWAAEWGTGSPTSRAPLPPGVAAWARLLTRAPEDKAATTPASEPMWRPVTCVQQPWATLALPPSGALEVRVRAIAVEGLWTVSVPEARTSAMSQWLPLAWTQGVAEPAGTAPPASSSPSTSSEDSQGGDSGPQTSRRLERNTSEQAPAALPVAQLAGGPRRRGLAVGLPKSDLARLQAQPEPRARRLDPALPSSGDQPPGVVSLPLGDLRPIPNLTLEKALSVPAFGASDDPTPASWRQASDSRRRMSLWPTAVMVPQHTQATDVVRVITPPTRPWRPMAAVAINAEAEALSVRAAPPRYSGGCAVAETTVSYSRGEISGRLTAEGSPAVDPSLVRGATFVDRCGLPGASPRFCNSSAVPPAFSSVTGSSSTGLNNGGLVEPRFGGPLLRLGLQAGGRLYRAQLVSVHTTAASQAGATDSGPLLVTSTAAAPPSEPRGLAFVPELASPVALGLRVLPPADNGGRTIQGYIVNLAGAGSETVSAVFDSPANDSAALPLTMVVGDLQPSSEYTASVAAFTSGLVGPAITPGKASTPDPIPCPGACSGNGACHAWNGKCTCNASVVGASCDKLAGLLVVAQMGDLPSSWDPWETAAALAFAIGAPAGRAIGLLGRAGPGMREVGVLLLAAEYSMETNSLAGSEGAQSGGDGRRALAGADWTFSSGEPYSPAAAVRLLRSTLRLTPRRLAGVGIAGLLLPPEGAGGASGLMPSSAWTESLEAPVAVPAVSCSERSGCGECMSDQACGWCLSDDRCVAGTGLGAVTYLAPDNGVDGRCTPRLGSPGGTPSSAMERWWLHVDAPTTAQRACPTPCSSLQGCNVCAARDDCVWCETLGQCASRASMGIDVDLSGVIQNPQLVGSVSDGSSPSRAPSIAGSGTCGRAVVKPGLCAATRCSSNHNLYHCVADPVCGWCDVPPAGQLPCSPGTSFGPTEGSAPCSSGTYYHRTRISCSGSSCADCLSQSACGWCESTQQCGSASLITGFPSAGHCSNWVAPVNALLSGVPDSMIRSSARALRAAPSDAVAVSDADANAGPMRSDRALAANSTDAAVAARGLADAVAFPRGAYYGSVDSISLHCPASTLPGDSICRPFKSCGDCLGQAKSLGCAWCDNPAGAPFCTSLVAGQTLCSADSRVGASDSNRGAPVLGSATHPDLTQSRCPMLCPQAAVLSAKEGTIQFGSLLDAQASPFESVYRPSEISSCSWFIKPAPTTRQSDGQPIETLIASVKVITFALGRGDGIIVFDGLGPVESSQVLAVFVNASTTTATTVGSQAASVAGPAAAPQSRDRTLSAAAPAHAPAPAPATVGDLPDWLRASLDSAASGRARLPLAHSARGGIEVGRFSIPDSTPVFTGPGAVTAQAGGDLRLVMAVGTGGGGWGFRATHTATQVSYTELQIVLQATGFTLLACVILLAAFLIVSNIRRRAAQRALAVQEAAAGAGADDRVPPRVAMSQDLIDAFPVFVFQKGKLEGTPLEPRKAASATDGGTAGTTPSALGQGTPASAQGRDGASGEEAGGVGDAGAGAGSAAAGAPPPIRIPVSPVGQGPAQACPPAPVAPAPAEEEEAPSCAVCMCEYEDGEQVRTLACNHSFHCKCIDGWMAENGTCPMCRSDTLEMAVMLLSLTEAGVASPIRIREDVPLVDADHVPRVPLLERLAREGAFSWLGSGHADDSGRESSDDEGDGDQQDSDAEDDHVAPGARAAGGDAVPLQRSSSSLPATALLPGAAVPPLSQAPRAAVVNPLLGSTQHAHERGNPGILRQRGASARVLTNPSRVALPRPPPPAAAPGPAERGGSDASARQVLASRHQGAAGDAPASGIINPMYR